MIVTNREWLERAVRTNAVDGFIVTPNKIGTVTEALDCCDYATDHGILAAPSGPPPATEIDDAAMGLFVGLEVPV